MHFEFVQVNEKKDRDKIKDHLRKLQSDQRRKKVKEWRVNNGDLKANSIIAGGPLAWRQASSTKDAVNHRGGIRKSTATDTASRTVRSSDTGLEDTDALEMVISTPSRLLGNLSAARKDPFTTYPIPWDPELDSNFDFLVHSLGSSMFGYASNQKYDIFHSQAAMSLADPAAFNAFMIITNSVRDRLAGRNLPGVRVIRHRIEAIRIINERFRTQDLDACLSETSIFTVMLLTGMEKQWSVVGDEPEATGLRQLLVQKGGLKVLRQQHPVLELALYGLALLTPRMLDPGLPALYESGQPHYDTLQEHHALVGEFLGFLTLVDTKARQNASHYLPLHSTFAPGTTMHELLISPPESFGILSNKMTVVSDRLRAGVIFYVHCMFAHSSKPEGLAAFLKHLKSIIRLNWIWEKSLRMFQWMLIKDQQSAILANPNNAWMAFRFVSTMCLLSDATQKAVYESLLGLLSGTPTLSIDIKRIGDELEPIVVA